MASAEPIRSDLYLMVSAEPIRSKLYLMVSAEPIRSELNLMVSAEPIRSNFLPDGVSRDGAVLDNRVDRPVPVQEEGHKFGLPGRAEGDIVLAQPEEAGHLHGEAGLQLQLPGTDVVGLQQELAHLPTNRNGRSFNCSC